MFQTTRKSFAAVIFVYKSPFFLKLVILVQIIVWIERLIALFLYYVPILHYVSVSKYCQQEETRVLKLWFWSFPLHMLGEMSLCPLGEEGGVVGRDKRYVWKL